VSSALELCEIACGSACYYLKHPVFTEARCNEAIADARAFFDLPQHAKQNLAIEGSPHFRGYSEMRNERDWREQIHFGSELEARPDGPAYQQLVGPNQWPADPAWRGRILALLKDLENVGREVLATLATQLGLPSSQFLASDEEPYLLLKMILYQPPPGGVVRSGVAPHVDFSWITLLLQDDTGGLEIRSPDGKWIDIAPIPGTLVVNAGEILEFASRGQFVATPHRVLNRSLSKSRVSLPFFLNPALATKVMPITKEPAPVRPNDGEHVHRVFSGAPAGPFVFGNEEWRRKGLGVWCAACVAG